MNAVLVSGAFVGLVYGLLGVGLVLLYRGSRVVNFAYGEFGMIAAYIYADMRFGTASFSSTDNGLWPALPVAVAVSAAIAVAVEIVLIRPLREAPRVKALIGTFAVASLLLVFAIR